MLKHSNRMKTQVHRRAALILTLAVLPLLSGCDPQANGLGPALVATASAQPAPQAVASTNETPDAPPTIPTVEPVEPTVEKPAAPPVPAGEISLPPSIKPSSPLAEIVKLAQSGVDEGVMLTYITNSGSTFGLGADEIVYLNDLGMPGEIITSIMEHDRALKHSWSNPAPEQPQATSAAPAEAPAEQAAAAPTYTNPPQAEPAPAEPQPANVTYNTFYNTLSPYGSWVSVDGYGMCWQPSVVVVNRGWQPYRDCGRWIYTDAGWYWYSDYTWGWAPFHYGRWFSHPRYGWCWNPGYTWGPSWVSWRYTDGYCGWAPLPPAAHYSSGFGFTYYGRSVGVSFGFGLGYDCYTFVPWNRFCNYRPSRYCAPSHQTRQIYNKSTVVNNVIIGDNNTIINRGVPVERVTAATKRDIQKVAIRDVNNLSGRGDRRERLERDGQTLVVHRPQPSQPVATGGSEVRPGRDGSQPAGLQSRSLDENRGRQFSEQRPTARPTRMEEPAPSGGRTFSGEQPEARPGDVTPQTRNSITPRNDPRSTTLTRAPAPRPIDVPSTRRLSPAGDSTVESPQATTRRPERNTAAPLVVRGSDRVNEPTARPANPQANVAPRTTPSQSPSLVVIGKRDYNTPSQRQGIVVMPQPQTRSTESHAPTATTTPEREISRPDAPQRQFVQPQASAPTRNWAPPATQNIQRQESPRPPRAQPQENPRPSYSAPPQRQSPPPQSYAPRPSSPAQVDRPSPSAPVVRPQPSPPAPSAARSSPPPSRQESPSRSQESRSRGRN